MLIFIVPLQSPAASKNWAHVSALCQRTLRSICGQTSAEFRVFLVCNEPPLGGIAHEAITVLAEDFAIPEAKTPARMADKWLKVKRGLVAARSFAPAHVMVVDADDCVHRDLAALSAREPQAAGWRCEIGFMHDEGSRWVYRCAEFHRVCGTSAIVRLEAREFPPGMAAPNRDHLLLTHGHTTIVDALGARGTPLAPLPFAGALYVMDTGENDSRGSLRTWGGRWKALKRLPQYRPFTRTLRAAFGFYDLDDLATARFALPGLAKVAR